MKKIMTLMLGLSFLMGTVSLFAQDKPADTTSTTKTKKKAKKKKATDTRHRQEELVFVLSLAKVLVAHAARSLGSTCATTFLGAAVCNGSRRSTSGLPRAVYLRYRVNIEPS
jgi:hypothetical protein